MPRYKVYEVRSFDAWYIIDAENAQAAEDQDGIVISADSDADSRTERIERVEEIGNDDDA